MQGRNPSGLISLICVQIPAQFAQVGIAAPVPRPRPANEKQIARLAIPNDLGGNHGPELGQDDAAFLKSCFDLHTVLLVG